jgi:hypothetical protein
MQLTSKVQIPYCQGSNRRAGVSQFWGHPRRSSSLCAAADSSKQPPPVYIEDSATQTFLNWAKSAGIQFPKLKVGTAHFHNVHDALSSVWDSKSVQAAPTYGVIFQQQPARAVWCFTR